jgi:hypothetical protein
MRAICLLIALSLRVSPVSAHQLLDENLTLTELRDLTGQGTHIRALVENTHKGRWVRCALYDASEKVLAVDSTPTKEFATEITWISGQSIIDKITSYRCIMVN